MHSRLDGGFVERANGITPLPLQRGALQTFREPIVPGTLRQRRSRSSELSGIGHVQLGIVPKSGCESLPDRQLHLRIRGDEQDRDTIRVAASVRRATRSFGRQFRFRRVRPPPRGVQSVSVNGQHARVRERGARLHPVPVEARAGDRGRGRRPPGRAGTDRRGRIP